MKSEKLIKVNKFWEVGNIYYVNSIPPIDTITHGTFYLYNFEFYT